MQSVERKLLLISMFWEDIGLSNKERHSSDGHIRFIPDIRYTVYWYTGYPVL